MYEDYCWTCGKFAMINSESKLCTDCYEAWVRRHALGPVYIKRSSVRLAA